MEIFWGWPIVTYLFLGGLGAGAYLTSFAAEMGWLGENSRLKRMGYLIGGPAVGIGCLLLFFDLGQGFKQPWLVPLLLTNYHSVMTWGTGVLAVFIMVAMIKGYLPFLKKPVPSIVTWAGAILALATGTYTGLLIAVLEAIPFWNSWIMPILFFTCAFSSGLSLTAILADFFEKGEYGQGKDGLFHILLIAVELLVLGIFMGTMVFGVNGPVAVQSAAMLVSGKYALAFWGLLIGVGLAFPLIVLTMEYSRLKKSSNGQEHHHSNLSLIADVMVLVGGFTLRALIIFAALPIWDGNTIF